MFIRTPEKENLKMVECPRCHKIYKKEGKCWNDHVQRGCVPYPQKVEKECGRHLKEPKTKVALEESGSNKRRRSPRLAIEELRQNQEKLWNLFTRQDNLLHELETMLPSL